MTSKGEGKIINLLNHAGIHYEREKTFGDLRHGLYRFDFFIPNLDGRKVVIEVNGMQHYSQIPRFHKTRKDFLAAQERDRRKISYCLANGIDIYCLPYWVLDDIKSLSDVFMSTYLARDRWKNDTDWREHKH